jgi:putative DNA methylase
MPSRFRSAQSHAKSSGEYSYEGPEIIYTFWAKHGPCQVTGCGHRTPIMTSPVMAVKTLSVKHWETHNPKRGVVCPHCGHAAMAKLGKGKNKKIDLSLLVHPKWLAGSPKIDTAGYELGGAAQDESKSTEKWNLERAAKIRLLEVRGVLPDSVLCPETGVEFRTDKAGGNVPKQSTFACASCGTLQDVMTSVRASAKTGPMAPYAMHCFSKQAKNASAAYNGRFFLPFEEKYARQLNAATSEWHSRKNGDLGAYWPREALINYDRGNTSMLYNQPQHGHTHWWTMFNPRQLLGHSLLLKAIMTCGTYSNNAREFVLIAFQQYLRNNNSYSFWNLQADQLEPLFSNNNYHPKSLPVENNFFGPMGRGNWHSCIEGLGESVEWRNDPWETVSIAEIAKIAPSIAPLCSGKSEKVWPGDAVGDAKISCHSSTDLSAIDALSTDLVITDPPFGALIHYADLADFFYPWLRAALKDKYPDIFQAAHTPRAVEVIANKALEDDADNFYQRLLTQCWSEAHRILKPGGILAFTFHHSEDEPWVAVLESLFDAGYYLEATYPIRSDETKGEGSQDIRLARPSNTTSSTSAASAPKSPNR